MRASARPASPSSPGRRDSAASAIRAVSRQASAAICSCTEDDAIRERNHACVGAARAEGARAPARAADTPRLRCFAAAPAAPAVDGLGERARHAACSRHDSDCRPGQEGQRPGRPIASRRRECGDRGPRRPAGRAGGARPHGAPRGPPLRPGPSRDDGRDHAARPGPLSSGARHGRPLRRGAPHAGLLRARRRPPSSGRGSGKAASGGVGFTPGHAAPSKARSSRSWSIVCSTARRPPPGPDLAAGAARVVRGARRRHRGLLRRRLRRRPAGSVSARRPDAGPARAPAAHRRSAAWARSSRDGSPVARWPWRSWASSSRRDCSC